MQKPFNGQPIAIASRPARRARDKSAGFTLLELLVVVAILAVLGGLAIGAFGDKTAKAAKGAATNSIAALDSAVRGFQATTGALPNNLDTMVCADPTAMGGGLTTPADYGGSSDVPGIGGGIGAKLNGKLGILNLPSGMVDGLVSAGISQLRYGLIVGADSSCDNTDGTDIAAPAALADVDYGAGFNAASPTTYPNGTLQEAQIPNRGFDPPVFGGTNRGRGFAARIGAGTAYTATVPVQVWNRGTAGANNLKVGGSADDVLVAFGIGNNSSILRDPNNAALASTAFYGDIGRDKYGRYVVLAKVGTATGAAAALTQAELDAGTAISKARLVAIVDTRGDFLDEEYAESTGQKI